MVRRFKAWCRQLGGKCREYVTKLILPVRFAIRLYQEDQVLTNAATITLFMVMSLFPMLMLLLWFMSRLTMDPQVLLSMGSRVLPQELMGLMKNIVEDLHEKTLSTPSLSVTIVLALWSASSGISRLVTGLNRVYKREEKRNWFVHRSLCLLYTVIFMVILIVVMVCLVFGERLRSFVLVLYPELQSWSWGIALIQEVLAIALMIGFFLAAYRIFPQKKLPFHKQLPGAVFSTLGWYGFSEIYSIYVQHSRNLAFMYGSLTVIVVFLVWMLICINIILIGGEINFLYNNRYYYKLYLLTEQKIDLQEYFMKTSD